MSKQASSDTYNPPMGGIFAYIPSSCVPYLEVVRLHPPLRIPMVILCLMIGLAYGASVTSPTLPITEVLKRAFYLNTSAFIITGALTLFSNVVNAKFDEEDPRTRFHPIARGAISRLQVLAFSGAMLVLGLSLLAYLPVKPYIWAITTTLTMTDYPFLKGDTDTPWRDSGFGYVFAVWQGMATAGFCIFPWSSLCYSAIHLGGSSISLIMLLQTIHSFHDVREDARAGRKTLPILLGHRAKPCLFGLTFLLESQLMVLGWQSGFSSVYYLCCGALFFVLSAMLVLVDLRIPADCIRWSQRGALWSLAAISLGIFAEYLLRAGSFSS
ncbi:UbiA prenyltransferase family-domain-containing protein [Talaromyces proteolyticus]|uniref:UbiA prenyltransferase family-domain-containing protein n=1 Tax=Talaromyces proteolyticus TaxID=1131652 RepID=A0AAD4KFK8_9EURO|nr:UbiA prenyltransferase family-domain-containing protein [Talaromyces proteolyticus]KAH8689129.1 UbiA prenyltransferase family-domain-containing protein [Talaromyces proteolyticus]